MRAYLLRTTAGTPAYEAIEVSSAADVRRVPRSHEVPTRLFDPARDEGRWVHATMCQGVSLVTFDHYALRPIGGGLQMLGWIDDPDDDDWPAPWGVVWTFRKPAPDARGRLNVRQTVDVYGTGHPFRTDGYLTTESGGAPAPWLFHPMDEFPVPPPGLTMHGCWTDDATNERHLSAIARGDVEHGWREWID